MASTPSAAVRGAAQELRTATAHAHASQKKPSKVDQLRGLSPVLSNNELTEEAERSDAFCVAAKYVSEIAHRKDEAPQESPAQVDKPVAQLKIVPPVQDIDANDQQILEGIMSAPGREVLFMQKAGGTLEAFMRSRESIVKENSKRRREEEESQAKQNALAPPSNKAKKPTPKKVSAAAALAKKRAVPSVVSARYPAAQLPLYAPAASGDSAKTTTPPAPRIEPGSRFLRCTMVDSRPPGWVYQQAVTVAALRALMNPGKKGLGKLTAQQEELLSPMVASLFSEQQNNEPILLTWNYVQNHAYLEAITDKERCWFGSACIGMRIFHSDRGPFAFRRWTDLANKISNPLCYACMLSVLMTISTVATSYSKRGIRSPFVYQVNHPGEYNERAFLQDSQDGNTSRVRNFCTTNLIVGSPLPVNPKNPNGPVRRRFVERPELRYADGTRHIPTLPLANPSAYINFDVAPVSNEDIIRTYIFKDIAGLYKEVGREMPDWCKVFMLAFLPFEQTVALLRSEEHTKFMDEYMPKDFYDPVSGRRYLVGSYDLTQIARKNNPGVEGIEYPPNSFVVFWALHIRINAAIALQEEGFEAFVKDICGFSDKPAQTERRVPTVPIPMEVGVTDEAIAARVGVESIPPQDNPWVRGPVEEALRAEMQAKHSQIDTFIESHIKLVAHLDSELAKGYACKVSDEVLLEPTLWGTIKPQSQSYLGPFYPEDRRYSRFTVLPHIEHQPGAAQLVGVILRQWCEEAEERPDGASKEETLLTQTIGSLVLGGKPCTWTVGAAKPLSAQPLEALWISCGGALKEPLPLSRVLTDFRETRMWVRREATDAQLDELLKSQNFFRYTWDYGAYHPSAMAVIMRDGAAVWRRKYSILVTLMLRIHFAQQIMNDLKAIRTARHQGFHEGLLAPVERYRTEVLRHLVKEQPESILDPKLPEAMWRPYNEDIANLSNSMIALKEVIYQLSKFINGHLPLAKACVVNCTDASGSGPLDAILCDTRRAVPPDSQWKAFAPSLFEHNYPCSDNVMCEDNLPDCALIEARLKVISDTGVQDDPVLKMHLKGAPIRCQKRGAGDQLINMTDQNSAWSRYSIQTIYCTTLGGYRSANYHPSFAKSLEAFGKFHDHSRLSPEEVKSCVDLRHISLNAVRENMVLHIAHNPGFHEAIKISYLSGNKDYGAFENKWLPDCADTIRENFDSGLPMSVVNNNARDVQGRNKRFVYCRPKTDFLKFIVQMLKEILTKRIVQEFMEDEKFEWPDVLQAHGDTLNSIFSLVSATDPHSATFDFQDLLDQVGIKEEAVACIKDIEETFIREGHASAAAKEEALAGLLDESDHLLAYAMFTILKAHASIRIVKLSDRETQMQIEAVSRRAGVRNPDEPFPLGFCLMHICGVFGCSRRKTMVVQERGLKYFGCAMRSESMPTLIPTETPTSPGTPRAACQSASPRRPQTMAAPWPLDAGASQTASPLPRRTSKPKRASTPQESVKALRRPLPPARRRPRRRRPRSSPKTSTLTRMPFSIYSRRTLTMSLASETRPRTPRPSLRHLATTLRRSSTQTPSSPT